MRFNRESRILLVVLSLLTWLIQGAVGPAMVGLPVTWAATDLAEAAKRWLRRLQRSDGLSRIVKAAANCDIELSGAEFASVRHLLEHESTWVAIGRGTVEDLADLIARSLPERTGGAALAAGRAIAAGLLEFAVRDLEPEWFQQVLFARLDRLQAAQATALDQAMLSLHADLAALLICQDAAGENRFAQMMGQLGTALDRLPPGPADRGEVAVYLAALINWLNADPWPQDTRLGGPALTPAAIERKLRIAIRHSRDARDVHADDLARRCTRLAVLGGPGTGKTWLARRTARLCAEAAMSALADGAGLEEVELPLYTTCARLSAAPLGHGIRRAIVWGALGQLPDLGGSRVVDALQVLFESRNEPTLLVADSLDEASGVDERIRQADSLPSAWRIVLTSRPASWNRQLAIEDNDLSRQVGDLQPLRYPEDVEPFIAVWFSGRPAWAGRLAAQIRESPVLQQAATVPLILAFYCIIGGDQPLPGRRADLYAKVIKRMLTGLWRGSSSDADPDKCLETLRDWAWSAATSDPVSGVGDWADEFHTARVKRHSRNDRDALDHVAVPIGLPDPDTGVTPRRFVHRSIQEHLVAEHVALRMDPEQAAAELLNHLWYDPDWEYAAPDALAMHPQRDKVLRDLIYLATRLERFPIDLSAFDGCWEIRRFLAKVALESDHNEWSAESAEMIAQARVDYAESRSLDQVGTVPTTWLSSDRMIFGNLNNRLSRDNYVSLGYELQVIERLVVTPEDRARARGALLKHLSHAYAFHNADDQLETLARLATTAEDRAQTRDSLLALLATTPSPWVAWPLAAAIAGLEPTARQMAQARGALLTLLKCDFDLEWELPYPSPRAIADLTATEEDRMFMREAFLQLFASETELSKARHLIEALTALAVAEEGRVHVRQAFLALLAKQSDPAKARDLAEGIARLDPTAEEVTSAFQALVGLLARDTAVAHSWELAGVVARLAGTAGRKAEVRQMLLGLLASETDPWKVGHRARAVTMLDPTGEQLAQVRMVLLKLLADDTHDQALELAKTLAGLDPPPEQQAQARRALLWLLDRAAVYWKATNLAKALAMLSPTSEESSQARQKLMLLAGASRIAQLNLKAVALLAVRAKDEAQARQDFLEMLVSTTDAWGARSLTEAVAELGPTAEQVAQARHALLVLADGTRAGILAPTMARLAVAEEDKAQACQVLLGSLASTADLWDAKDLVEAVAKLDATAQQHTEAREALLRLLGSTTSLRGVADLANALPMLEPTAEDLARARQALLRLLAIETDHRGILRARDVLAKLRPTIADLDNWRSRIMRPGTELLAAIRHDSATPAWIEALPSISEMLSG